jgi:carbonic anhydrase
MDELLDGVRRFQTEVFPLEREHFASLADQQQPIALFITCSDSRVVPNLITQTKPGELFLCRDVGNIVPRYGDTYGGVSATIEYAVSVLRLGHVVVCGHFDCGAMRCLLDHEVLDGLPSLAGWLAHAEITRRRVLASHPDASAEELLPLLVEQNVVEQLANLRTHPAVADAVAKGRLELHGWTYRIETGEVTVYDPVADRFVPAADATTSG